MLGRHRYAVLAVAVLGLAVFNLTFRLGRESLTEWDSSLYATSALEMVQNNEWVATTFDGRLDYSNSKPPLNVWLIALTIKGFGPSLVAVSAVSAAAAWLTVLVLLLWGWHRFGPPVGVLSALVLATGFGFLYVHSGRSANPDSLLTLLLLLTVVVLDCGEDRPWCRVWLGPLLAGVFLLKGMAFAMPALLIAIVEARRTLDGRARWRPLAVAAPLAVAPVAAWAAARWRIDEGVFFMHLLGQDFVGVITQVLDGQRGSALFYLNILVKHHYDWIVAALTAILLFPPASWRRVRVGLAFSRSGNDRHVLLGAWSVISLLVPTLMQTKLPWYVNPFYPMLALGVGWVINDGLTRAAAAPRHHRHLMAAMIAVAAIVAESKLIWYSYTYRALGRSVQGLLLSEADRLRGARVFRSSWDRADAFVLKGLVRAERAEAMDVDDFLMQGGPNDYFVDMPDVDRPELVRVGVSGDFALYRRRD